MMTFFSTQVGMVEGLSRFIMVRGYKNIVVVVTSSSSTVLMSPVRLAVAFTKVVNK